jgi:iron complex outermembrane receptor protein
VAHTRIADDGINNGNGGSDGANNVICDDDSARNAPIPTGKTVKCHAVNNNSAAVTNTIKQSTVSTETTLAMFRQEFAFAKTTAYLGMEVVDISDDSTTYGNRCNALQAQAGHWAKGAMTATGQGDLTRTRETTPFVHIEFSPTERLRLHLGERFGKIDYNVDDRSADNNDVVMTRKGDVLRMGATCELNKDHLVRANWGETFNPQSTRSLNNSDPVGTANNVVGRALSPERGLTKEIGFRGLLRKLGLRYDLTLFDAYSDGFIITRDCTAAEQTAFNGRAACTLYDAAGKLALRGLESTFSWAVTPWLDLGATYKNAHVWFKDYKTTTFDYSGKDYRAAPRHKLNLRIGVKPAPGWLVELEGDHISKYYVDNTNDYGTYQRRDLFSLRASYRTKAWTFWLHALNLTDQKYATRVSLSTIAGVRNVLAASAGQGKSGS